MVCVLHVLRRDAFEQFQLNFQRSFARREPCAIAHPEYVCVDRHGGLAKGNIQHHVGGFAAHSRQLLQGFSGLRHLSTVVSDQDFTRFDQVGSFAFVQTNGAYVGFKPFLAQLQHGIWGVCHREQQAGGFVHAHVCGLRRQQHGGQQLKVARILKLCARVRVCRLQSGKKRLDVF